MKLTNYLEKRIGLSVESYTDSDDDDQTFTCFWVYLEEDDDGEPDFMIWTYDNTLFSLASCYVNAYRPTGFTLSELDVRREIARITKAKRG